MVSARIVFWLIVVRLLDYIFLFSSIKPKDEEQPESRPVRVASSSTWKDLKRKAALLLPYMWPRGSGGLQALVLLCVVLLGLERIINVFVPIYSKDIGEGHVPPKLFSERYRPAGARSLVSSTLLC